MLLHNLKYSDMLQILKGEKGGGKTSFIIRLLAEVKEPLEIFLVRGAKQLSADQMIKDMLGALTKEIPEDSEQRARELTRQLKKAVRRDIPAALVIDDADDLTDITLHQILEFIDESNAELDGRLHVLLAAHSNIEAKLAITASSQVRQGKVFVTRIRTYDHARTAAYLEHRLRIAGATGALPLNERQIEGICSASGGVPDRIDRAAAGLLNKTFASPKPAGLVKSGNFVKAGMTAAALVCIAVGALLFLPSKPAPEEGVPSSKVTSGGPEARAPGQPAAQSTPTPLAALDQASGDQRTINPPTKREAERPVTLTAEPEVATASSPEPTIGNATSPQQAAATPGVPAETAEVESKAPATGAAGSPPLEETQSSTAYAPRAVEPRTSGPSMAKAAAQTNAPSSPPQSQPRPNGVVGGVLGDLRSAEWLLRQPATQYAIQLIALNDSGAFSGFVQRHNLAKNSAYFKTLRNGRDWYVLLYGLYPNADQARRAIAQLPAPLRRNAPWIRSLGSVHQSVETGNP
jgi:DamX protein